MTIRMLACEPSKPPEERFVPEPVASIKEFLNGWFEVAGIGNKLLLYRNERSSNLPFNRMVRGRPIFGNFLVSKLGPNGKRIDLSDQEVVELTTEFIVPTKNNWN